MATTIRIGHAGSSENQTANGVAGDSTGREVCIIENYSITGSLYPTLLLRPLTEALAAKSAAFCEAICANDNVGYSQDTRNTLYTEAQKVNFNGALITTKCNTDCSAFMTTCAIAGGSKLDYAGNGCLTDTMKRRFSSCGDYKALTDKIYFESADYLQRGDILVRTGHPSFPNAGHTVMVLDNGSKAASKNYAMSADTTPTAGTGNTYSIINNNYLRIAPSIDSIESRRVTVKTTVIETTSGTEKQLQDQDSLSSYSWKYMLYSISNPAVVNTEKITALKTGLDFSIASLQSNNTYGLKVLALKTTDDVDEQSFACSPELLFTTLPIRPPSVNNLKIILVNNKLSDIQCKLSFDTHESESWTTTQNTHKGYRLSLLINNKVKAFSDTLITVGSTKIENKLIYLSALIEENTLTYGDSIQLGIQTWIKDEKNNLIFDSLNPSCSQPIILTAPQHICLDKLYLKLNKEFKRTFIDNRKDKE